MFCLPKTAWPPTCESQLPEVNGCYCESARTDDSGGLGNEVSQMKDAERRDKLSEVGS